MSLYKITRPLPRDEFTRRAGKSRLVSSRLATRYLGYANRDEEFTWNAPCVPLQVQWRPTPGMYDCAIFTSTFPRDSRWTMRFNRRGALRERRVLCKCDLKLSPYSWSLYDGEHAMLIYRRALTHHIISSEILYTPRASIASRHIYSRTDGQMIPHVTFREFSC